MSSPPVDLDNCADEPIHIPGSIQPHGTLVAVTPDDLIVRIASANSAQFWGAGPDEMIGRPLTDFQELSGLLDALRSGGGTRIAFERLTGRDGRLADVTVHGSNGYLLIETEAHGGTDPEVAGFSRRITLALQGGTTAQIVERAARATRRLTGFDRVMVYRFDHRWNGEVIAEDCRVDLNRFLGLHYPASDIPAQARAMYRQNWIRSIPDIAYTPVPLAPAVGADDAEPLDLSGAFLRSVSPVHIEYLSNMGVTASMSVSLICDGVLWGLIACHHYSGPLFPSAQVRAAAEFLGQVASIAIAQHDALADREYDARLSAIVDRFAMELTTSEAPVREILDAHADDVLTLARAQSAAVVVDNQVWTIGSTPSDEVLAVIRKHAETSLAPWHTDELDQVIGQLVGPDHAGALACQLSPGWEDLIVWFREEQVRHVDWGGDPHNAKIYAEEGDSVRLSPRKSFDQWREVVRGTSVPWESAVIRNAGRASHKLAGALLREQMTTRAFIDQLQDLLRPRVLPKLDDYEVEMWYQPSDRGQIGGDWFDVVEIDEHHIAFAVGDVNGHGVGAAFEMTQLRHMLRAYLVTTPSPAGALVKLDAAIRATMPGTLATCICAVMDRRTGRLAIANAGHVPALHHRADVAAELTETGSDPLLGLATTTREEIEIDLRSGDLLVLFSDGLVEERGRSIDDGLNGLLDLAGRTQGITDLHQRTRAFLEVLGGQREDDVCVLAIRRR